MGQLLRDVRILGAVKLQIHLRPDVYVKGLTEGPFVAGDCLLAQSRGGPLTRKQLLKPTESAAITDPLQTFLFIR
jgi:hypothetical protein